MSGYNKDLNCQIDELYKIVTKNSTLNNLLNRIIKLDIPDYYIGAGCIAQTVWNYLSDFPLEKGINDIDIAYFDDDIFCEKEDIIAKAIQQEFRDIKIKLDVKNQAHVHKWYNECFGYNIEPIKSLEDGINRWPTTSTAIGIKKDKDNNFVVYAPFGLNDLFNMTVRANKIQITKEIYEKKVRRWISIWPDLKIINWEE